MQYLYVFYDASCGICTRLRSWCERRPAYVPLLFVPAGSAEAHRLLPAELAKSSREDLTVLSSEGGVYQPSLCEAAIMSRHLPRSQKVRPNASSGLTIWGAKPFNCSPAAGMRSPGGWECRPRAYSRSCSGNSRHGASRGGWNDLVGWDRPGETGVVDELQGLLANRFQERVLRNL